MLTIRAMAGGVGYAARHLEHSDYYDEQRRIQGEWHGRGAELLGLRGEVTREQFEAIREGSGASRAPSTARHAGSGTLAGFGTSCRA
ncbi:MAG: relaxase domain-containing protein [Acidobacteriaceae bacterium]